MEKKCTKCGLLKDLSEFAIKKDRKCGRSSECKKCHRVIRRAYYKNNNESERKRIYKRRSEIKRWYKEYKESLSCSRCPENDSVCLEFHHTGEDKDFAVSEYINRGFSKEKIKEEISKCIVLCANCHRKEHKKHSSSKG